MTMGVRKYAKEVIKEGKRVRWPKRDVFLLALVTTLVICVFCALVLRLEDLVSGELIKALKEVFKGVKK
jgi:preprotein translocase SecE subunit